MRLRKVLPHVDPADFGGLPSGSTLNTRTSSAPAAGGQQTHKHQHSPQQQQQQQHPQLPPCATCLRRERDLERYAFLWDDRELQQALKISKIFPFVKAKVSMH